MLQGWVSLHRDIINWEWYDDVNTCRVFIHCLLRANHEPAKWRGIDIDRGQFISSVSKLALETSLSVKQVRTSLGKLNKTGEVASEGRTQHTVFTIKNYDKYQSSGKPNGKPKASDGQAKGKRGATNNNNNNEDNEDNENKKEKIIEDSFGDFWDSYHKKQGRAQALKAFKSAIKREGIKEIERFSEMLITDCKQRVSAKQFGFDNLNASTYLNNNRWEDDKSTPANSDSGTAQPDWMRGIL